MVFLCNRLLSKQSDLNVSNTARLKIYIYTHTKAKNIKHHVYSWSDLPTYLGDDLRDVFQWLFDWILCHVPLKSGDIGDEVDWREWKRQITVISINHIHSLCCNDDCISVCEVIDHVSLPSASPHVCQLLKRANVWRLLPPLASRFSCTLSRLSSRTSAMYWATFFTTLKHNTGCGDINARGQK